MVSVDQFCIEARSVLQDLGLNILLYEKQTRLINSKSYRGGELGRATSKFLSFKFKEVSHRYKNIFNLPMLKLQSYRVVFS